MSEALAGSGPRSARRTAVVIPCYDEAATIGRVVADFARELPEAEIYVFDNNSSDGSGEIALRAGATVVPSPLQGKGAVLTHMSERVDADTYLIVDADDTYPASAARKLVERQQEGGFDMVVATRLDDYERGAFRPFHRFGNHLVTRCISLLFRTRLTDVLSGYRVLSRTAVDLIALRTTGFEAETEMTLQCLTKGLAVAELPVEYKRRPRGSRSKLSTWSDGFLILKCVGMIFKDYRPLPFFTALAVLLALASLATGSAPIRDYIEMRYVVHVPRAILAAALGILSMISLTVGLILDSISKYHLESIRLWKRMLRR